MSQDNLGFRNREVGIPETDEVIPRYALKAISRSFHYLDVTPADPLTGLITQDEITTQNLIVETGEGDQRVGNEIVAGELGQLIQFNVATQTEHSSPDVTYTLFVPSTDILGRNFRCELFNNIVGSASSIILTPKAGVTIRKNDGNILPWTKIELLAIGNNEYVISPPLT